MIKLYKFGQIADVCDPSPFCVKVEAYLRLCGLNYETQSGPQYLRRAPKGKLPFIEDNGRIVADSSFILSYLNATYGEKLDTNLSAVDKSIAHAFIKMVEESLYWVVVHARWGLEHNSSNLKRALFDSIPFPMNQIIAYSARKGMHSQMMKQGIGRHSTAEITEIGNRDLHALADFLGAKTYFFGETPTTLDIVAYACLVQLIRVPYFSAPIIDKAKTYDNLVEFTNRFHARYFYDLSS
jgi:glutathione S-transferase